ncbi:unnamed protein product [Ectocarpus sp. CCAP 1310/34]|nr:unnamed protein product [Ectocarpus sp. CCAP 1310/34]
MFRSASRASAARAHYGRAAANALAAGQQQRNATTAAVDKLLLCRGRNMPSTLRQEPPLSLGGRIETLPRPRRGFASAVATTLEDSGAVQEQASAAAAAEAKKEQVQPQQAADASPKPRRRRLLRDRPAPITLTDRAASHLISLVANKPGKVGVRLGVRRRGCNGMSYTLKYADEKPKGDEEVVVRGGCAQTGQREHGEGEQEGAAAAGGGDAAATGNGDGVKLFVDPMATLYIAGTVMDWEETELSSEFTFTNPNAKGECGCGESFNV